MSRKIKAFVAGLLALGAAYAGNVAYHFNRATEFDGKISRQKEELIRVLSKGRIQVGASLDYACSNKGNRTGETYVLAAMLENESTARSAKKIRENISESEKRAQEERAKAFNPFN